MLTMWAQIYRPTPHTICRKEKKNKCKHSRLENKCGTRFCTNCGLVDGYIPYDDTCKHPHLAEKDDNTFCTKELFVSTNNKFIASSLSVFVGWVARDTYYRGMRLWISS